MACGLGGNIWTIYDSVFVFERSRCFVLSVILSLRFEKILKRRKRGGGGGEPTFIGERRPLKS